jgi:hypothetical protein
METLKEYLYCNYKREIPHWLANYKKDKRIDLQAIKNTPCVFYPGSGNDGQPINTFNAAHACHLYIYCDYMLTRQELENQLETTPFKGYKVIGTNELSLSNLAPSWHPHVPITQELIDRVKHFSTIQPYCFMTVFERQSEFTDAHGAKRFAVIFIGGDGIASYDALFGNKNFIAPLAVVLQDHGFGGNYAGFGKNSLLETIAIKSNCFPKLLLVGSICTEEWNGFYPLGAPGSLGGIYSELRQLFAR